MTNHAIIKLLGLFLVLAIVDVLASLLVWNGGPTDMRTAPPSFENFEIFRLARWSILFLAAGASCAAAWRMLGSLVPRAALSVIVIGFAMAVEVATSEITWRRLPWTQPYAGRQGGAEAYLRDHLFSWFVIVGAILIVWYAIARKINTASSLS